MGFRRRLLLMFLVACGGMGIVWARVAQLQLLQGDEWAREAHRAREQTVELDARRGPIVDAAGRLLVEDTPVLQLALVLSDWNERARLRCDACGAILFREAGAQFRRSAESRRPPRCRCKAAEDRLIPLGEGDLAPLEDLLEMPHGTLAARAEARQAEVDRLVEGERRRLLVAEEDDFLIEDRVRLYREWKEELPIPLVSEVKESAARFVALDETGVTRGLILRPSHRRAVRGADVLARVLGATALPESLAELRKYRALYPDDDIDFNTPLGKGGLEKRYDAALRGRPGRERRARNEQGTFAAVVSTEPPQSGRRLHIVPTLEDCEMAQRCLESLPDLALGFAPRTRPSGALVLMDASNGEILALAELPTWKPDDAQDDQTLGGRLAALADRATGEWVPARRAPAAEPDAERLRSAARLTGFRRLALPWRARARVLEPWTDLPEKFDRDAWRKSLSQPTGAMLSRISRVPVEPGSALKPFIGLAMLESGMPLPIHDVFTCTGMHGSPGCHPHGAVDFESALCQSCNQYFAYSLRDFRPHWLTYRRSVATFMDRLGFGHATGSDLVGEARGRWLRAEEWQPDETPNILADDGRNVAIGQGEVLVTPLQMVRAVAVIANGGRLVTPHLARRIEDPAGDETLAFPVVDLEVAPASLARVREGMRRVVYDPYGTAYRSFAWGTLPCRVYGKTGTSEVGRGWKPFEPDGKTAVTHQWFVGFVERDGRAPLAFAVVYHARTEKAAGLTAARTAGAFLSEWCGK